MTAPRLPAPWGSGDVQGTGATVTPAITGGGGGARVGRSLFPASPAQLLPPPYPAPAPSEASCAPLEVGISVPL